MRWAPARGTSKSARRGQRRFRHPQQPAQETAGALAPGDAARAGVARNTRPQGTLTPVSACERTTVRRVIDLALWERREAYAFFNAMGQPYCSVTCELDVSPALAFMRQNDIPSTWA